MSYSQMSIFDLISEPKKITKPIRLIELFAGIGSQAKALENLGVQFEHYRVCEFDKYAVKSYNAIHGTNFETSDITKITADNLGIVDTVNYEYIMTYSFPCQDLSNAGKMQGMTKGSGTRSGLLWEVERLLNECKELPQILLMENVSGVHGKKNLEDWKNWLRTLEAMGYSNYYQDLNAKNYGVPQNRNRCFMVSLLNNYTYTFPKSVELTRHLCDLLEEEVDEKFYLSRDMIKYITATNEKWTGNNGKCSINKAIASTINTGEGSRRCDASNYIADGLPENFDLRGYPIKIKNATKQGYLEARVGDGIDLSYPQSNARRGRVQQGMTQTVTTQDHLGVLVYDEQNKRVHDDGIANTIMCDGSSPNHNPRIIKDYRIRKLTPLECWRLMGFDDVDFKKAQEINSNTQLYKQAGNSIVVNVLMAIFKQML